MTTTAIILIQGSELLCGSILDHNAHYLCAQLHEVGIRVLEFRCVDDNLHDIAQAFVQSTGKADIVISTGGLGPTEDDLTRLACAHAFSLPLAENIQAQNQIHSFYKKKGREVPKSYSSMSALPSGSVVLENKFGSAPAFYIKTAHSTLYCLPGVPIELEGLYKLHLKPIFSQYVKNRCVVEIACFGAPESTLSQRLKGIKGCQIAYRASRKSNSVKLIFNSSEPNQEIIQQVKDELRPFVFAQGHSDLAKAVGERLIQNNASIAIAESCTAGKVAAWIASVPGASRYLLEGVVVYSNDAKQKYCSVHAQTLERYGAVSAQVAKELAVGVQKNAQSTWGLSITGIAGPGGGSVEKPVGTVHIAVSNGTQTQHRHLQLHGSRAQITDSSAAHVLFLLFQQLEVNI